MLLHICVYFCMFFHIFLSMNTGMNEWELMNKWQLTCINQSYSNKTCEMKINICINPKTIIRKSTVYNYNQVDDKHLKCDWLSIIPRDEKYHGFFEGHDPPPIYAFSTTSLSSPLLNHFQHPCRTSATFKQSIFCNPSLKTIFLRHFLAFIWFKSERKIAVINIYILNYANFYTLSLLNKLSIR